MYSKTLARDYLCISYLIGILYAEKGMKKAHFHRFFMSLTFDLDLFFKIKRQGSHFSWFRLSTVNTFGVINLFVKIVNFQGALSPFSDHRTVESKTQFFMLIG